MSAYPELRLECAGKWHSVLQSIGIDARHLNGRHGPCVLCKPAGHDRARWVRDKELYYCNQCGCRTPISLAMDYLNLPFKDVAQLIRPQARTAKMTNIIPLDSKANEARLKKIHGGLQKLHSSNAAGLYLLKRGLSEPPDNVFYHPGIPYYDNGDKIGMFPVMVSRFQTASGLTASYHLTYLTPDGQKAKVPTPKKFLPVIHDLAGGAIRLREAGDTLGISEGVETGMALMAGEDIPVWAAGSAVLLEKMQVPDSVKLVVIAADSDKSFTGQAAAYALAKRLCSEGREARVITLIDDGSGLKARWDSGLNLDYWDYRLTDTADAIGAVEAGFGPLAQIETTLGTA
jgi:putative DNA primase/helicase